jgi:hypothetical protein
LPPSASVASGRWTSRAEAWAPGRAGHPGALGRWRWLCEQIGPGGVGCGLELATHLSSVHPSVHPSIAPCGGAGRAGAACSAGAPRVLTSTRPPQLEQFNMMESAMSSGSLYSPGSTLNYSQAAMMGLSGSHGSLQDAPQLGYASHGGIPNIILTGEPGTRPCRGRCARAELGPCVPQGPGGRLDPDAGVHTLGFPEAGHLPSRRLPVWP